MQIEIIRSTATHNDIAATRSVVRVCEHTIADDGALATFYGIEQPWCGNIPFKSCTLRECMRSFPSGVTVQRRP